MVLKRYLGVRNHFLRYVSYCPSGRLWAHRFAALMNCKLLEIDSLKRIALMYVTSDVYMDAVNRKLSIDLLVRLMLPVPLVDLNTDPWIQLSAARRSRGRQFVLISPGSQAEVKVKEARDVKISE